MKKLFALALSLSALLISCGGTDEAAQTPVSVNVDETVNAIVTNYSLTDGFVFTSSSTEIGEYLDDDMIPATTATRWTYRISRKFRNTAFILTNPTRTFTRMSVFSRWPIRPTPKPLSSI